MKFVCGLVHYNLHCNFPACEQKLHGSGLNRGWVRKRAAAHKNSSFFNNVCQVCLQAFRKPSKNFSFFSFFADINLVNSTRTCMLNRFFECGVLQFFLSCLHFLLNEEEVVCCVCCGFRTTFAETKIPQSCSTMKL